jgi:hypothetical protein
MASTKNTRKDKNGPIRRMKTAIKKLHELGQFPGVEVATVIRKQGKITTYESIDRESWWPVLEELVRVIKAN